MQFLSKRNDIDLLIYTCSHKSEIKQYEKLFNNNDIIFKYSNNNKDVPNNASGCYDDKLYFNVLLEDKDGFNHEEDWTIVYEFFKTHKL